jgi:hypothetical protein
MLPLYIYINFAAVILYTSGNTVAADIIRGSENAIEQFTLMFPASLLLNLMVIVYDMDNKSVGGFVRICSLIQTATIVTPIILSIWITDVQIVLLPRTAAVIMDLPLMMYVNYQLSRSTGGSGPSVQMVLF